MEPGNSLLTLVIPAYNEEESLPNFIGGLIAYCEEKNWKIIIVNDGSKDNTKNILNKYSENKVLKVVHHKLNRGYGGALKTGIRNVTTKYCVTIDADGQHDLRDVDLMFQKMIETNADMIVGSRKGNANLKKYREFGKSIIRSVAKMLMPLTVYDINSGMKMYDAEFAKRYITICPDGMAFSDTITLTFIYQRNLVLEMPINIKQRIGGESTIGMKTAFETVMEIVNIVTLFNPLRIFLPLSIFFILISLAWEVWIFISKGYVVSTGALLGFITGLIFFLLGLIAEQLGNLRRSQIQQDS
ncbi:glycosyltransferase family 2 protein [Longitalea luteola]|uniref:glycosyltransferase family 2 protein n=1 Tax=Longitalea luteola TaxID=2812563 RepID=UPI001A975333|nr:glycosyltransferase family 2 protein [Longitalea luteola]